MKKTASQKILATLNGRKRPITANEIATKTGVAYSTVRSEISILKDLGYVNVAGTVRTGGPGRPANKYVAA